MRNRAEFACGAVERHSPVRPLQAWPRVINVWLVSTGRLPGVTFAIGPTVIHTTVLAATLHLEIGHQHVAATGVLRTGFSVRPAHSGPNVSSPDTSSPGASRLAPATLPAGSGC